MYDGKKAGLFGVNKGGEGLAIAEWGGTKVRMSDELKVKHIPHIPRLGK